MAPSPSSPRRLALAGLGRIAENAVLSVTLHRLLEQALVAGAER